MKDYLKFLNRLPAAMRNRVIAAVDKLAADDLKTLDIKKLSGEHALYRCRIGKIRILFQRRGAENYVLDIGFRGDIYKD